MWGCLFSRTRPTIPALWAVSLSHATQACCYFNQNIRSDRITISVYLFFSINLLSFPRSPPLSVVTSQLWEKWSCGKKLVPRTVNTKANYVFHYRDFQRLSQGSSILEQLFSGFLVLWSFNKLVSIQQRCLRKKYFQWVLLCISCYSSLIILCSSHLSCLEAIAPLPGEILNTTQAPTDFDWTAPSVFIYLQKLLPHSATWICLEFAHQKEINWKIRAEQTCKTWPCLQLAFKPLNTELDLLRKQLLTTDHPTRVHKSI